MFSDTLLPTKSLCRALEMSIVTSSDWQRGGCTYKLYGRIEWEPLGHRCSDTVRCLHGGGFLRARGIASSPGEIKVRSCIQTSFFSLVIPGSLSQSKRC
jgi:hypothetical protein